MMWSERRALRAIADMHTDLLIAYVVCLCGVAGGTMSLPIAFALGMLATIEVVVLLGDRLPTLHVRQAWARC